MPPKLLLKLLLYIQTNIICLGYVSNLTKALSVLCLPWFTWWTSHCLHDLVLLHTQPTVSQALPEGSLHQLIHSWEFSSRKTHPWAFLSHQSYWDSVLTDKPIVVYIFLYFCLTSQSYTPLVWVFFQCKGLNFLSNKLEKTTLFTRSSYSQIPIAQITLQQARASHPFRSAISLFFSCTMRLWCMRWKSRSFWVFSRSSLALLKKHHQQQPSRQLLFIS